jgi:threonine dehydrogenase-like Zn-dependent dehydrogenase
VFDRVVPNGPHAEKVRVPKNHCSKIPDNVSDEEAAFTILSAIALQGIRLSNPTLGEAYVVIGLGAIGLITAQLLKAHGCRVLASDFDSKKCQIAQQFGVEVVDLGQGGNVIEAATGFSHGNGIDAVIITAATKSNEPLHQAATICRKRGRIISSR